ncbi:hypothetical protein TWF106_008174 [Orbilia oligospora]|uniref:Uncharacterized protein n=1 Tax=Orbilia oligospora TaxID=2813651 RepID=A0A6G1MI52_ORBOL|nr:hypothetical protein TWF788_010687 [Orbilia oligospora]KAF3205781.1 hypothetical protein TWF679_009151 [Orbilia oligospora]KAF3216773.1 hypothetical protein TWF106_008174 [Orbilia oligospora]KAF3223193.1 hypothetical protein TWF191_006475 [Orbilia oligospora]KAF3259668.1 hypothetical protein TWF192_010523 [Orbilia oligospora]
MSLDSWLQYRLNHQVDLPIAAAGPIPAESFSPPTNCEITRVARCLYQLFLYLLYCECNFIYPKRGDPFNGRAILDDDLEDTFACDQEAFNGMMATSGFHIRNYQASPPKIGNPILPNAPRYYWKSHVQNAEWYTVAALGPQELWKFLFESSFEEQKDVCAIYVEGGFGDPHFFIRGPQAISGSDNTYPPYLRICKDEFVIGECDDNGDVTSTGAL